MLITNLSFYKDKNGNNNIEGGRFMLLDSNTERVINLALMVVDLKGIDKIRLAIHLFEESYFLIKLINN